MSKDRQDVMLHFIILQGVLHQPARYALSKEYLGGSLFSTTYKAKTGKKAVNIWDLHREYCVNEIVGSSMEKRKYKQIEASKMGSQLYSLSADGQLELFDLRSNKCIGKHNIGDDVVGIIPELTGNERCVISGHRSGRINFFDNRMNTGEPCLILNQNIDGHSKGTMTVIHAHSNAPIFTTATSSQVVKVWSANGEQLGVVRAHTSILGHPVGPAKCLAFSPFSLKLASGGEDSVCAVYSLEPVPGS
jgi:regulator-associated protein of mTOR